MSRHRTIFVIVVLVGLVGAACQPTETAGPEQSGGVPASSTIATVDQPPDGASADESPSTETEVSPGVTPTERPSDAAIAGALAKIAAAYAGVQGVWDGYQPRDHPVVLAWKDAGDELIGAVAINHPDPGAIGQATPISPDGDGAALGRANRIDDIEPEAARTLSGVAAFEFVTTVGGVDSFVMVAGGSDGFFDPQQFDYSSTLLHELFHRYQIKTFGGDDVDQDVEGYDYGAENLAMAALEDRALIAALDAAGDEASREAASRFVAVRQARLAADERVRLDESQEAGEGTARYIEHRFAGSDTSYNFHDGNFASELVTDPTAVPGVKDHYGFGRWYATGAAMLRLLDRLDVDDVAARVEGGESPALILADALGVADADLADLVAQARSAYDPDGELADLGARAAQRAATEGPVFGDGAAGPGQ